MFAGLSTVSTANTSGGMLYGLGKDRQALGLAAITYKGGQSTDVGITN